MPKYRPGQRSRGKPNGPKQSCPPTNRRCRVMQSLAERQRTFAAALLDPRLPTPVGLVGPDGRPSSRRFGAYRNNLMVGLLQTLNVAYPAVLPICLGGFFSV